MRGSCTPAASGESVNLELRVLEGLECPGNVTGAVAQEGAVANRLDGGGALGVPLGESGDLVDNLEDVDRDLADLAATVALHITAVAFVKVVGLEVGEHRNGEAGGVLHLGILLSSVYFLLIPIQL